MTPKPTTPLLAAPAHVDSEVSLVRLYLLRAMYLVLAIGGGIGFCRS